jgi:putative ABC transport system substrate-binding protein
MRRREFIAGLGGAAAWPLAARAQQSAVPVIGYLDTGSLETRRATVAGVHHGLSETGFVEGRNLEVVYRWAEDRLERLPSLAADLVHRQVAVIVAIPDQAALAAKAATNSTPIVFLVGVHPDEIGLVTSLHRPGSNLTGISSLSTEMAAKRLQLLREFLPAATSIAFLVNPANPAVAETESREMLVVAGTLGVHLLIVQANDVSEFDAAFAALVRERAGGLVVSTDVLFLSHPDQLVALAARHRVPAIYRDRGAPAAGGLLSYGTDLVDARYQVGVYTGRILKGEKPADLPVQQVIKTQLVINLKAAKALGLTIPVTRLATADEVIE